MNEEKSCITAVAWNGYKSGMENFLLAFVYLKSFFIVFHCLPHSLSHPLPFSSSLSNSSTQTNRGRDPIMTLLNFIGIFMQSASDAVAYV